jgi:Family of unknown function (DUF5723)
MKTITGFVVLAFLILIPLVSSAQLSLGSPSTIANGGAVTAKVDEWMAIGVNPANLGWDENPTFSFSILNFGADFQAQSLYFSTFSQSFSSIGGSFSNAEKQNLENVISPPGLVFNSEVTWISSSFFINKIGGFGIGITDRVFGGFTLNRNASNILFNGINPEQYVDSTLTRNSISKELDGSTIAYTHLRELNIDFGRKILQIGSNYDPNKFEIFGGIGLNYIWGLANLEEQVIGENIAGNYSANNSDLGEEFSSPGHGLGIDLGLSAKYKLWKFGISVTDLGFVRWTQNRKESLDTTIAQLEASGLSVNSIYSTSIPFTDILQNSPAPDYTTNLPTQLRLGADYEPEKMFEFSSDLVFPLNKALGNLPDPYMVVAGEVHAPKGFDFNMGIEASALGVGIPMGIFLGPLKLYVGTGDIFSLLGFNKNSNLSLVVGIFHYDF